MNAAHRARNVPRSANTRPDLPEIPPTYALRWALSHLADSCQVLVTHGFVGLRGRDGQIVSNDAAQITVMLETAFAGFHRPGSPDLYPPAQRREIEAVSALVFSTVNNGVYKAGLAATQAQYEEAFDALFTTLAALEERLSRRRFLLGDQFTEADIRLFPTLARFDAVYYLHFKCNLRRLVDY